MPTPRYTNAQIVEALQTTLGRIYLAAEKLGCQPSTIYRRAERSRKVAETIEHYSGRILDIAESALNAAILNREPWAIRFTLQTIGRKRGFSERVPLPPPVGERFLWKPRPAPIDPDNPRPFTSSELSMLHDFIMRRDQADATAAAERRGPGNWDQGPGEMAEGMVPVVSSIVTSRGTIYTAEDAIRAEQDAIARVAAARRGPGNRDRGPGGAAEGNASAEGAEFAASSSLKPHASSLSPDAAARARQEAQERAEEEAEEREAAMRWGIPIDELTSSPADHTADRVAGVDQREPPYASS